MKGYFFALTLSASLLIPAGVAFGSKQVSKSTAIPQIGSFDVVTDAKNRDRNPYHSETRINLTFNRMALLDHRITLKGQIKYHGKPSKGSIQVNLYPTKSKANNASDVLISHISFHVFQNLSPEQIWICSGEGGSAVNGLRLPLSELTDSEVATMDQQKASIKIGEETLLYAFQATDSKGHSIAEATLSVEIQPGEFPTRVTR